MSYIVPYYIKTRDELGVEHARSNIRDLHNADLRSRENTSSMSNSSHVCTQFQQDLRYRRIYQRIRMHHTIPIYRRGGRTCCIASTWEIFSRMHFMISIILAISPSAVNPHTKRFPESSKTIVLLQRQRPSFECGNIARRELRKPAFMAFQPSLSVGPRRSATACFTSSFLHSSAMPHSVATFPYLALFQAVQLQDPAKFFQTSMFTKSAPLKLGTTTSRIFWLRLVN